MLLKFVTLLLVFPFQVRVHSFTFTFNLIHPRDVLYRSESACLSSTTQQLVTRSVSPCATVGKLISPWLRLMLPLITLHPSYMTCRFVFYWQTRLFSKLQESRHLNKSLSSAISTKEPQVHVKVISITAYVSRSNSWRSTRQDVGSSVTYTPLCLVTFAGDRLHTWIQSPKIPLPVDFVLF